MAQRLPLLKHPPRRLLDWWPSAGGSRGALREALPDASLLQRIDAGAPARVAGGWRGWLRSLASDPVRWTEDVPPQSCDMLWANMLLHHVADPGALLAQWNEALAVDGVLMFTTLGPGTLQRLRDLYRQPGWGPPMGELVDMHDIGDQLVEAGFADPVMDQETLCLTWSQAADALIELRTLGANVAPSRRPGLRTPRWRQRLLESLVLEAATPPSGRVALDFEIIYGHAFKPQPRHPLAPEVRIGLDDLRRTLKRPTPDRSG